MRLTGCQTQLSYKPEFSVHKSGSLAGTLCSTCVKSYGSKSGSATFSQIFFFFFKLTACFKCCVDSQLVEAILHMQVKAYLTTITLLITILSSS